MSYPQHPIQYRPPNPSLNIRNQRIVSPNPPLQNYYHSPIKPQTAFPIQQNKVTNIPIQPPTQHPAYIQPKPIHPAQNKYEVPSRAKFN